MQINYYARSSYRGTVCDRCGSVVTKDVPDGMVACGVPAKVIMTTEEYALKSLHEMEPYDKDAYQADKKVYLKQYLLKK